MPKKMIIRLQDELDLEFEVDDTPIARAWVNRMQNRHAWPLDDRQRFYGFENQDLARQRAEQDLRYCIGTINAYQPIIDREFTSVDDQDLLNYLHHIFETYHGLLDKQDTDWWHNAPAEVRQALAMLNIAVHRAESSSRNNLPRFVCTWFGMPKDRKLDPSHMIRYGRTAYEFGGVYLHYVEIGKTLEDLSNDDDHYIGADAFQPFMRYSADFSVRFYDECIDMSKIEAYFNQHRDFFVSRGIQSCDDYRARPLRYKVASLIGNHDRDWILQSVSQRQMITDIYLS
jgi:hypothetical protein